MDQQKKASMEFAIVCGDHQTIDAMAGEKGYAPKAERSTQGVEGSEKDRSRCVI